MCILRPYNERKYKIDGCFVDPEERFAFIHIYKNASISLRNALGMRGRYFKYKDVKDKGLKTITIIRHPIRRVISMYLYLLRLEDNGRPNQHPVDVTKECCFYKKQDDVIESFILFLNAIRDGNYYDAVTYPQINFLMDRGLILNDIDEVFVQENLSWEFPAFLDKYGINYDGEFPVDNTGDKEKKKIIQEYIDRHFHVKLKIMNMYSADIDLYNNLVYNRNRNLII
jgi:hypothetical protein